MHVGSAGGCLAPAQSPCTVLGKRRQESLFRTAAVAERMPASTMLYRVVVWAAGEAPALGDCEVFSTQPPTHASGHRVMEYALHRALLIARCEEPPSEEAVRGQACDGWCTADGGRVTLIEPASLLRLTDDYKQRGVAQAFITDMFRR